MGETVALAPARVDVSCDGPAPPRDRAGVHDVQDSGPSLLLPLVLTPLVGFALTLVHELDHALAALTLLKPP